MADANQEPKSAQLQLWDEPAAPVVQLADAEGYERRQSRAVAQCPSCRRKAASVAEDARMRADMRVLWLHPDPAAPDGVREAFHCQHCQPRGPVGDTECARCPEEGPLLAEEFAADSAAGKVPAAVAEWLAGRGWHLANGALLCPNHHQG
ncbi:hypothetical protein D7D52_34740 [Nocardia yunnanensis]|uniref:Uncharacterized protein n=1 Tax=Nocardia yunnanensis TaxID=2382165 RepID=A0A386ZKM5_9NOCA|nr:hypothetical protein [Nocardia yunnanensis]AYF78131.1 hypothetical protein D7D52_34740 [Nocardia yunnanensis]